MSMSRHALSYAKKIKRKSKSIIRGDFIVQVVATAHIYNSLKTMAMVI